MAGLRVIGGAARGRKLRMVPGERTRPIGDRVKESLFNIIGRDVEASAWLDLFAGTGSVGIEALSRGARRAVFVDSSWDAVGTVRLNLETTGLAHRAEIVHQDAFTFLDRPSTDCYDYVYLAPPQYLGLWISSLRAIDGRPELFSADSWTIVQIDPREDEALELARLNRFDERVYGQTKLMFYQAE